MLMGLKRKTCGWGYLEKVRRLRNSLGNKKKMSSERAEKYKQYFHNTFGNRTNQDRKTGTLSTISSRQMEQYAEELLLKMNKNRFCSYNTEFFS
jgi:hypothetical protein